MPSAPSFRPSRRTRSTSKCCRRRRAFLDLLNHPKTQDIIKNAEIAEALKQIDLKDLMRYLQTGKSPRYDDEKILGRWALDPQATLIRERKRRPDMSAAEMNLLRKIITITGPSTTFVATPEDQEGVPEV